MFWKLKTKVKKLLDNMTKEYCCDEKETFSIMAEFSKLKNRVKVLEEENISLTNELYRMENSIDTRIDILYNNSRHNQRYDSNNS